MKVKILSEWGHHEALLGLGLSHGLTSEKLAIPPDMIERLFSIAAALAHRGRGHNKFLRQVAVYLDIKAPRYWWIQFDQYKVGVVTQSESTMHTIMKQTLTINDFDCVVPLDFLTYINGCIARKDMFSVVNLLPQGYLQRRIVSLNYAVLQEICAQRQNHKLDEWKTFIDAIKAGISHPEWVF